MRAQADGTIAPAAELPWGRWLVNGAAGGGALLLGLATGRLLVSPALPPLLPADWASWGLPVALAVGNVGLACAAVGVFLPALRRPARPAEVAPPPLPRRAAVLDPAHLNASGPAAAAPAPDRLQAEKETMLRKVFEDNLRLRRARPTAA